MKLWRLEGVRCSHTYGQVVLVIAESEERARVLAKRRALSRNWLNPTLTSCVELPLDEEKVIYAP